MWIFKNKYFLIFLLLATLSYLFIEAQGEGDLFIYYCAAHDLGEGQNIYLTSYLSGYHYYYSVLFAYILNLFEHFPFYGIKFSWLLLNIALYYHLFVLLKDSKYVKVLNEKNRYTFLFLVFIFSFRFLHHNIHYAQITILILWTCIYSLVSFENDQSFKGAALLALGINIKLLPLVFLPYLLYRGYFKGFFLTIGLYFFYLLLPSLLIGHQYNIELLSSWYHLINPTNSHHVIDTDERSFHGLSTLLATLLLSQPPDTFALTLKRNLMDVSVETLTTVLLITRASLVLLTLLFLKWPPFKKTISSQQRFIEISYILLLIPLIFPHQQHYAFLFSVPAFAFILYYLIYFYKDLSLVEKRLIITSTILIYLTANLSILLGEFNRYYEHYKIITYGALLLIPLLVWINQNKRSIDLGTSQEQ